MGSEEKYCQSYQKKSQFDVVYELVTSLDRTKCMSSTRMTCGCNKTGANVTQHTYLFILLWEANSVLERVCQNWKKRIDHLKCSRNQHFCTK